MNQKTAEEALKDIGFDEKEIKIYMSLLHMGESTATKISQNTRIERTLVYYIIEKLFDKGLLSYKIKNNVKYYSSADPSKILADIKEKESVFKKVLPFLEQLQKQTYDEDVKVEVFKDVPGLKAVINDFFKQKDNMLVIGEQAQFQSLYPEQCKQYIRKLKENKMAEKVLVREDLRGKILKSENSIYQYISKNLLSPTTTSIYSNKILISIWEKPMFHILITSKKISDSYRAYFNYLWKMAKK